MPRSPNHAATTINALVRGKKGRRTRKAMKSALFDPFRPLMIPLSGAMQMVLLTKGRQKIFLIGENHTKLFCRQLGFTPIAQIIENYLDQNTNVDFMIEMDNKPMQINGVVDEIRTIANEGTNRATTKYGITTILMLTRILAQNAMRQKPTRVHWLEPHYPPPKHPWSRGDTLINEFFTNTKHVIHNDPVRARDQRLKINQILFNATATKALKSRSDGEGKSDEDEDESGEDDSGAYVVPWTEILDSSGLSSDFEGHSHAAKVDFFKHCYETLSTSKFFIKCRKENRRNIPFSIYRNAFFHMWANERTKHISNFYFLIQRFIMDMFTCCRIMKTHEDPNWFNNIVIYAGDWHVRNYVHILTQLDYQQHELPNAIRFNPTCA
jgi:hypothetical protein